MLLALSACVNPRAPAVRLAVAPLPTLLFYYFRSRLRVESSFIAAARCRRILSLYLMPAGSRSQDVGRLPLWKLVVFYVRNVLKAPNFVKVSHVCLFRANSVMLEESFKRCRWSDVCLPIRPRLSFNHLFVGENLSFWITYYFVVVYSIIE